MPKDLWGYDGRSHRVFLNVGEDGSLRRGKKARAISTNLLNRPRVVVLIVIVTVFLFLFLKEARLVLASNPQFVIQDIVVENTKLITKDMVDKILNLDANKGLFGVSTNEIVKLLKNDPDIDSVSVEKILPGTLKIDIVERAPYAKLSLSGKYYFIDNKGVVLLRDRTGENVPVISGLVQIEPVPGETCDNKVLENILNVIYTAGEIKLGDYVEITGIDVSNEENILIHTREKILVKLKLNGAQEKLDKLMIILSDVQKRNRLIKLVDLRYRDAYVE